VRWWLLSATCRLHRSLFAKEVTRDYVINQKGAHVLGLRTVIYRVPSLADAKAWYTDAFCVSPYFDEPFYVGFSIGGYELGLLPNQTPGEASEAQNAENVLCYWGVDDIESEYQRLLALGAVPHQAPTSVGEPIVVATARDPWGNLIGLIYNPTFQL
jgi:lactoylglutathione lyase